MACKLSPPCYTPLNGRCRLRTFNHSESQDQTSTRGAAPDPDRHVNGGRQMIFQFHEHYFPGRPVRWLPGLLALVMAGPVLAADLVIGTAGRAGVYYQVGRAVCALLDSPCEARVTDGSAANLKALREGALPIALAQSDLQYHAVNGSGPFAAAGPDSGLRALFSVHGEPFTLVVRQESGIRSFDELRGRRVNIGNPGSGQRATMEALLAAKGWTKADFALANELPADQQSLALCHDRVEAMVYTVGHPNDSVAQAVRLCQARLAEVAGPAVEQLVAQNPYYAVTLIPGGLYGQDSPPVRTFGVKATVVAAETTDPELVYRVVKAVFDNFDDFKARHPAWGALTSEIMIRDGLSAPLHEGALRYYRERGWL